MWNVTSFEKHLNERLTAEFGPEHGGSYFAQYVTARDKVLSEIETIGTVQPQISDHGPRHIRNVLDNVSSLISTDPSIHHLSALDLYLLGMVVIFHDTGNVFGRTDHHVQIAEIFDWARGTAAPTRREKMLVLSAARAHTGTAINGSRDTLATVAETDHFEQQQVHLRNIAAVLRFADELAEGPQRTTDFFRKRIGYALDSAIYHRYASVTHISADRNNERIRLTYEVQLSEFDLPANPARLPELTAFIQFVQHRISKLDEERRYARFYCDILRVFKATTVAINFFNNSQPLDYSVSFQLDDLVIPGDGNAAFDAQYPGKCLPAQAVAEQALNAAQVGST